MTQLDSDVQEKLDRMFEQTVKEDEELEDWQLEQQDIKALRSEL